MSVFNEIKILIKSFLSWLYLWLGFSFFFFTFGLKEINFLGKKIFFFFPLKYSFAVKFLEIMKKDLLPPNVQLIATNPLSAFLAQLSVALAMAFLITFPILIFKIFIFLWPAFYTEERKVLIKIFFPSFLLFSLGCFFGYFVLIPPTFKILYSFTETIGAISYFSISEFISLVFGLILVAGIIFLLPIFMIILTRFGIIEADFWKKNWRYAVLIFLIFSAIITPDGTGITMMILSFPLTGLYLMGTLLAPKKIKNY